MQVTLTVRHGEANDALKGFVRSEVEGLSKFFDRLVEADIVLDQEGHRYIVEVRLHTSNDTHFASAEAGDFRAAIDQTVGKLRRQLDRHKGRLSARALTNEDRALLLGTAVATARALAEERGAEGAPPEWDRITSAEAIVRLRETGEEVLVFVDTVDGGVKIARRDVEGGVDVVAAEAFEAEER
jgi:putative sigma-54 modulation protein